MSLKQNLGKNIKYYRKLHNLTQEQFADLIGIDCKNVSKIENGNNYPSPDTLTSIINVLGIEFYELFVFDNQIPYEEMKKEIIKSLENKKNVLSLYRTLKNLYQS